jgi:hypothetical protein
MMIDVPTARISENTEGIIGDPRLTPIELSVKVGGLSTRIRVPAGHDDRPPPAAAPERHHAGEPSEVITRARRRSLNRSGRKLLDGSRQSLEPIEQPCPNCQKPMLANWGVTCGQCRPALASPKTLMLAVDELARMLSMTLGWMVVVRTPDPSRRGTLIELIAPVVIFTRQNAVPASGAFTVALADDYLSVDHATLRRPKGTSKADAFTIEDRRHPGPSKNGTFVNGRKLAPSEVVSLCDGDTVHVGATTMVFKSLWLPHGA